MIRLKIDSKPIEVPEGTTLLEAAQQAGADIPTLCYEKKIGAIVSCMLCVVKDRRSGRMLSACAAKADEGMDIDTLGEDVHGARRDVLHLLISEHAGDCEAPCARICPAGLDIPRMLRHIAEDQWDAAARIAKRDLIFPRVLSRICTAPCERGCRRATYDAPVAIRRLHGEAGKRKIEVAKISDSGKRVAIVGAGLAGLAAAYTIRMFGHACRVCEKAASACPALRALEQLPGDILDAEIASVREAGVTFAFNQNIDGASVLAVLAAEYDAVIVACEFPDYSGTNIFHASEDSMPVRAIAKGKAAAQQADRYLCGIPLGESPKRFHSRIGQLDPEEKAAYAINRLQAIDADDARAQAARCLHCECAKPVSCKLRKYAEEYGIFALDKAHGRRPQIEPMLCTDDILFDPGKCVKCGLCVETARRSGGDLGLAFAGRGPTMQIQVPFGESLARGLGEAAEECVRICPTGALAFRETEHS